MDPARREWRGDRRVRPRQGRRSDARIRRGPLLGADGSRQAGGEWRRGARRSGAGRRLQGVVSRAVGQAPTMTLPRERWREIHGVAAFLLALIGQQLLVALALRRNREHDGSRHRLTLVDAITLSRGGTGALMAGLIASSVRDRRGR